ncbi:MAG: hypothetical protein AUJ52_02070 [Elusimicrobia bacterium CG1_02_63_36]|nr:MAG: hypothetical protein AUJ52_02070 [Elusimicrobia bacterium CG1_02_63_36]PIP83816.1 MAG: hypothetical protein COR54_07405 [Elusimicrobia bacterium CG22_combo_CG10-13_8_21_14_all_63_91]PJA16873.1 MAG: hypothetical protein COX66_06300 [Elusimicrobia bacterium CG_4_10_14_0_2_um_filter_63_34]
MIKAIFAVMVFSGGFVHAVDSSRAERRAAYKQWDAGVALVLAGEEGKAKEAWEACLRLDPENADCRAGLQLISGKPDLTARAEPSGAALPEPGEENPPAAVPAPPIPPALDAVKYWNAGIIYFQKGDYPKALAQWRLCAAKDAMNKDCRTGIDRVEGRLALPKQPAPAPKQDEAENPKDAKVRAAFSHWNAGILHYQKGELEKAREEWTLCRSQDPTNMDCHTGLLRIARQYGGK